MGKRGRPLQVVWQDSEQELRQRYRREKDPELRTRWHGLWLTRGGRSLREVARLVSVNERTVHRWVSWYRKGGLGEVGRHRNGGRQGGPSLLTEEQRKGLLGQAGMGAFFTVREAVSWVEDNYHRHYTYDGMRSIFRREGLKKKLPRPLGAKTDLAVQEAWKRGTWRPT